MFTLAPKVANLHIIKKGDLQRCIKNPYTHFCCRWSWITNDSRKHSHIYVDHRVHFFKKCDVTLTRSWEWPDLKKEILLIIRNEPIDRPVIGIRWFFAWPARIGDQPVSLTSCRFRADPFITSGAGRNVTATRTRTVACKHVVSRENDSNFNGIQCKRRLIMYLCCARWGLHSLSE